MRAGFGEREEVETAHEVPGEELGRDGRAEIISRIAAGEGHFLGISGRGDERGEVAIHPRRRVGRIGRHDMGDTVSVMQGEIEGRAADQRGEGRDGDAFRQAGVELLKDAREGFFQEVMADFQRMPVTFELRIGLGQRVAEILQRLQTDVISHRRGPDPLHAERGLAPPFGPGAVGLLHGHADAGADDARDRLVTDFQR